MVDYEEGITGAASGPGLPQDRRCQLGGRELPEEFFLNRSEQARIKSAIMTALPSNLSYYNLIIALAELLVEITDQAYKEDVFTKPPYSTEEEPCA
jgi:hypothetical protein